MSGHNREWFEANRRHWTQVHALRAKEARLKKQREAILRYRNSIKKAITLAAFGRGPMPVNIPRDLYVYKENAKARAFNARIRSQQTTWRPWIPAHEYWQDRRDRN